MTDADTLISAAFRMVSPRPGFFDELLKSLKTTPLLLVPVTDSSFERTRRFFVAGSIAAGAGVAGATTYTIARRKRRKGI
ncbi:MAG TPA: hypothetical protein VM784_15320 [Actinomycetota bacterium]|nr:hypothetical protein [Actinomycetota bacterium]